MAEATAVAQAAAVELGRTQRVIVDGVEILLCNVDGKFYAIEDVCTHDGAPLDQGELDGRRITCPRHGAVFDVITGAVLALPAVLPVRTFVVKVTGGVVYIELLGRSGGLTGASTNIELEDRVREHVPTKLVDALHPRMIGMSDSMRTTKRWPIRFLQAIRRPDLWRSEMEGNGAPHRPVVNASGGPDGDGAKDQVDARRAETGRLVTLRINRGEANDVGGRWEDYEVPLETGMVVLDAVLYVQTHLANDLAVRWNCKAAFFRKLTGIK